MKEYESMKELKLKREAFLELQTYTLDTDKIRATNR